MPVSVLTETSVDGRRARGERTRLRVLDALLALVEEGQLRPTVQEVAERAGVALRTVYHHFEDVEALRRTALDVQLARHMEILRPIEPENPLDDRIAAISRQFRRLFEAMTPIRRATLFDEYDSTEMAEGIRRTRLLRRAHLEETFAPELAKVASENKVLLDAVDAATSWQSWHHLRHGMGRSVPAAERVMTFTLGELLDHTSTAKR